MYVSTAKKRCRGNCGCGCNKSGVRKIVQGGLRGLGQDETDIITGLPTDLVGSTPTVTYPASPSSGQVYAPADSEFSPVSETADLPSSGTPLPGYGYGPSQSGGVALYPTSAALASPSIVSSPSFDGLSTTEILLGGGAFILLVVLASSGGGRRR